VADRMRTSGPSNSPAICCCARSLRRSQQAGPPACRPSATGWSGHGRVFRRRYFAAVASEVKLEVRPLFRQARPVFVQHVAMVVVPGKRVLCRLPGGPEKLTPLGYGRDLHARIDKPSVAHWTSCSFCRHHGQHPGHQGPPRLDRPHTGTGRADPLAPRSPLRIIAPPDGARRSSTPVLSRETAVVSALGEWLRRGRDPVDGPPDPGWFGCWYAEAPLSKEPGRVPSAHCPALGAHGPIDGEHVPGKPSAPRNWNWTSLRGHDNEGGDRRHLGCTSNTSRWRPKYCPRPHPHRNRLIRYDED
jgi:hypothetical protein